MVDIVKGVGVHPHPHQPGLIFPSCWNIHQKAAVATLCTLGACGHPQHNHVISWAGIFKESMGARNLGGRGLSYRPARLHRLAEFIPWNRFRDPYTFKNTGSDYSQPYSERFGNFLRRLAFALASTVLYASIWERLKSLHVCAAGLQKENKNFLIYKETQMGSVAKSYMTDGLLIFG